MRALSSWGRLADAEVTGPINGQGRSMKPGKPISQRKRSNRHHLTVLFLADTAWCELSQLRTVRARVHVHDVQLYRHGAQSGMIQEALAADTAQKVNPTPTRLEPICTRPFAFLVRTCLIELRLFIAT